MKKIRRIFAFWAILWVAMTGIVQAATSYPAGGIWKKGVNPTGSYSHYYHETRRHSAIVSHPVDGSNRVVRNADVWAKANNYLRYSGCSFYYNVM